MSHRKKPTSFSESNEQAHDRMATYRKKMCEKMRRDLSDEPEDLRQRKCPRCGRRVPVRSKMVERTLVTLHGEVTYRRHQHYCEFCRHSFFPKDIAMKVPEGDLADDVEKLALDFTVDGTFRAARERMEMHHRLCLSETVLVGLTRRLGATIADHPGKAWPVSVPFGKGHEKTPVVVQHDGSHARCLDQWHEVKLLSVGVLGSTERCYWADAQGKESLLKRVQAQGLVEALVDKMVLWVSDGAEINRSLQEEICPQAHCVLDFYHAKQHAYDCAKVLFSETDPCVELFAQRVSHLLWTSQVAHLIAELKECYLNTRQKVQRQALFQLWQYYQTRNNWGWMDYATFLKNRWPIGSGEIESAHRHVLQHRIKLPGMKWKRENLQRMVCLRALRSTVGPTKLYQTLRQVA